MIKETSDWTLKSKIQKFMEVAIPEDCVKGIDGICEELDSTMILGLIMERQPFLSHCVEKAIILEGENKKSVLTASVVTEKDCEGHFKDFLIIPLLLYCKIIALTGEILICWLKKSKPVIPLARSVGKIDTPQPEIVKPPALVITEARFLRGKMGFYWVRGSSWVWVANNSYKNIAVIEELIYSDYPQGPPLKAV